MSVRAKFRVSSITDWGQSREIKLNAVYETDEQKGADPENVRFAKATPSGEFKMMVDNPGAYEQFAFGQEWYLDMTLAKPAT